MKDYGVFIDPYTDFGFKRIFGWDGNVDLQEIPLSLKSDPIFKKLFMETEISNYSEEQAEAYYASMKERWDRFAIEETARKEGKLEGRQEGSLEKSLAIALQMKRANEPIEKIALYTGLEISRIEELQ